MVLRLGLVGRGQWGRIIERTLGSLPDLSVRIIGRGQRPAEDLDGVLIATPSATHAEIALPYIAAGIATFIEKPMAISVAEAERIGEAAERSGAPVFVGHIHLHNPAFLALQDAQPKIGAVRCVLCEGMNNRPRTDSSVLWDWLPHHLTMARAIFGRDATSVAAWRIAGTTIAETAACNFQFGDVRLLSVVSWHSPVKRQCVTIAGAKGSIVFDDTADRKLTLFAADGAVSHPAYADELPLTRELKAFVQTVRSRAIDRSHIDLGLAVARMVCAAEASMQEGGAPQAI